MEWTKHKTIQLIKLLRPNEVLWNPSCKYYRNRNAKNNALQMIAKKLKLSEVDVEKKIQNLKCQFHREAAKEKNGFKFEWPRDEAYVSKWYGYELLQFLNANKAAKVLDSNQSLLEITPNSEVNYPDASLLVNVDDLIPEQDMSEVKIERTENDTVLTTQDESNYEFNNRKMKSSSFDLASSMQNDSFDILTEAHDYIPQRRQMCDEFSLFGEFVANELRSIRGEQNRIMLKKKILDMVFETKISYLHEHESCHSSSQTHPSSLLNSSPSPSLLQNEVHMLKNEFHSFDAETYNKSPTPDTEMSQSGIELHYNQMNSSVPIQ